MADTFEHQALSLTDYKPLVYTAMSKHLFYFRMHISKFVLEQGKVPLNPFMIFEYFMLDTVDRDVIRRGNNSLVQKADEVWVFGNVSDGALAEIKIAKASNKPVRYFNVVKSKDIVEATKENVVMEADVEQFRSEL